MRYVYAHFPINVNLDKNAETGNWEVEIRYVPMDEHRPDWTCWERKGRCWGFAGRGRHVKFATRLTVECAVATLLVRRSSGGS